MNGELSAEKARSRPGRRIRQTISGLMLVGLCLGGPVSAQQIINQNGRIIVLNSGFGIPAPPPFAVQPQGDCLQFSDGSELHGQLTGIEPGGVVQWSCPDANKEIRFMPDNVDSIRFSQTKSISFKPRCRIRLVNGDELPAEITSMDWERVALNTWFAGAVSIARSNVQSIVFLPKNFSYGYEGPGNSMGWVIAPPGAWHFRDGVFTSHGAGALASDLQLSGSSTLEFALSWTSRFAMQIGVYLERDSLDYSPGSFSILMTSDRVSLHRNVLPGGGAELGSATITPTRKNGMRVAIQCNQAQKSLALYVDNQLVHRWKDEVGFVGKGSRVLFSDISSAPGLEISDVRVSRWDGIEPDLSSIVQTNIDSISLANGDRAPGKIVGITEAKLEFELNGRTLQVPLERITKIEFAAPVGAIGLNLGEVRATLAGGTTLSFDLKTWSRNGVSGQSPLLGNINLDPSTIRELSLNPMRPRPERPGFSNDEFGGMDD